MYVIWYDPPNFLLMPLRLAVFPGPASGFSKLDSGNARGKGYSWTMCKWSTYYAGEDGYVVECADCRHVQLGFGTVMLTLSRADFIVFAQLTANQWACHVPTGSHRKCIVLPTPVPFYKMLLTEDELQGLDRMLQRGVPLLRG